MKKLFRFFILAAMAVALVAPFNRPKTVEASDKPPIRLKVGETYKDTIHLNSLDRISSDAKLSIESSNPEIFEVTSFDAHWNNPTDPEKRLAEVTYQIKAKKPGEAYVYLCADGNREALLKIIEVTANDSEVIMNRLYNPNSGEHFYTSSAEEKATLVKAGWKDEGTGWKAPPAGDPVYRLYNKNGGEHHYTLSAEERDNLKKAGWNDEGIGWYSDPNHGVSVYRVYNPNKFANNHHYTTSTEERDHLVSIGWRDEKIAWYGVK